MNKEMELDSMIIDIDSLYEYRIGGLEVPTIVKRDLINNEWDTLHSLGVEKIIYGIEGSVSLYIKSANKEELEKNIKCVEEIVRPYKTREEFEHKMKLQGPGFMEYC
jgi:hypothetical protein